MARNFAFLMVVSGYYGTLTVLLGWQFSYFNCEYDATRNTNILLVKLGMYLQLFPSWAYRPVHTG